MIEEYNIPIQFPSDIGILNAFTNSPLNNKQEQLKSEISLLEREVENYDFRILTRLRNFKPKKKMFESSEEFNKRWLFEHELLVKADVQDSEKKRELEQKIEALQSQLEEIINFAALSQPTTNNNLKDF